MESFALRFLCNNLVIAGVICGLLLLRRLLASVLSARLQYRLWFGVLVLLAAPFFPARPQTPFLLSALRALFPFGNPAMKNASAPAAHLPSALDRTPVQDFYVSVSSHAPGGLSAVLLLVWISGIAVLLVLTTGSLLRLRKITRTAFLLQDEQVSPLLDDCRKALHIRRDIPVFCSSHIRSPFLTGILRPRIYLPQQMLSEGKEQELRYIFLHELSHYKCFDVFVNHIMTLCGIIYWFNPFVHFALHRMQNDCELACDASVLNLLPPSDYPAYGNALLDFAERLSRSAFPFAPGIGGNVRQIKLRILHIAGFRRETLFRRIRGGALWLLTTALLLGIAPALPAYGESPDVYPFRPDETSVTEPDLSALFDGYDGCFVLYNADTDSWQIYNREMAVKRTAPASTYKIYAALLGLEQGIITPADSQMAWDGTDYPFNEWEADQDLSSAMHASVNWYFQAIDRAAGANRIHRFLKKIGYGNQTMGTDLSLYWADSSLQISPVEQTLLLEKFHRNDFHFSGENVDAVKDALLLPSASDGSLSGKTGTTRIDGKDVNGWFIGYMETAGKTRYFATYIQGEAATGGKAAEITKQILSQLQI